MDTRAITSGEPQTRGLAFHEFFAQLSPAHLTTIYEQVNSEALEGLRQGAKSEPESANQLVEDLITKLPTIVLNLSMVMTTHLLQSYHNWLVLQLQTGHE